MHPILVAVFFVVPMLVAAIVVYWIEGTRRRALAAWAERHGFRFVRRTRTDSDASYRLLGGTIRRHLSYHATKRIDGAVPGLDYADLALFEYYFHEELRSPTSKEAHFTCALVDAGLEMGDVRIRREGFGDRIAAALGAEDIDFEDEGFSRTFWIQAKSRKDAYKLLDPRLMDYLMADPDWAITTAGPDLFVCRPGRPNPAAYSEILDFVLGFLERLPRPLVNQERERCGLPPVLDAGSAAEFHE